jgi:hypothetical protein
MKQHEIRTPVTRDGRRQFTPWQKRLILREHVEQGVSSFVNYRLRLLN